MMDEIVSALLPVVQAFDDLGVAYLIGGSVASTHHGIARTTLDADLVADLPEAKVRALVSRLEATYYIDADSIRDAIRRRASFNVIHLESAFKVDVYVLSDRPFDRTSFTRARASRLDPEVREMLIESPEDVILHKLEWYRLGREVADRQWTDVLGVMKLQRDALDVEYLRRWAQELGVEDLLDRAVVEAGLTTSV